MVLICISLVISGMSIFSYACQPSTCLLWRNVYLGLLSIYWFELVFWYWVIQAIYISEIYLLSATWFANIFFQNVGCLFILLTISFAVQKHLCLIRSQLFILLLFLLLWETDLKKYRYDLCQNVLPVFSSRSFPGSCLIFKIISSLFLYRIEGVF